MSIARRRFAAFVMAGKAEGHSQRFYGGQFDSRVIGEEDFVSKVLPKASTPARRPTLNTVVAQVCASAAIDEAQLCERGKARTAARARAVVGWLALKSGAATLTEVANHFNRDVSTLSHAIAALERRSRNSESFANALDQQLNAICQA